jgi:hypothetical protein
LALFSASLFVLMSIQNVTSFPWGFTVACACLSHLTQAEDLPPNEGKRAEPFQQRKGYSLFLELLDLNMIDHSLRNDPLQVEVSMGLFGDCHEHPKEELQGKSMTYPVTPLFDGDQYYYIPFEEKKPCLQLISEWEDIDYR